jgi:hypothetical protein
MKARVLFTAGIMVLVTQGCSVMENGLVRSYTDDFTGGRRYLLTQEVQPQEWATEIGVATMMFEKRISDVEISSTLYLIVNRTYDSFRSEEKGYIRIDDKMFGVSLAGSAVEHGLLSAGVGGDGSESQPAINGNINEKFRIELTNEIVGAINEARRMEIRLYFGPEPATYRLQGARLSRVRRLLNR